MPSVTLRPGSRLTLGDSYTPGDVFDGLNFRGVQIASDDNMLADSLRGSPRLFMVSPNGAGQH
jgi:outer membrane usher protein FimD/PapC